ncbi:MAG: hypothetical protein AB1448_09930 [Pseudomonadota bacterium]
MAKVPAAARRVQIEHLLTVEGAEAMRLIGSVLFCHLMLEQILYELLAHAASQSGSPITAPENIVFADKVRRGQSTQILVNQKPRPILAAEMADALLALNNLRVSLAHTYGASPSFESVHAVAAAFEAAGVDFTDDMASGPARAREYGYEATGLVEEATKHAFFDLALLLLEAGGPDLS